MKDLRLLLFLLMIMCSCRTLPQEEPVIVLANNSTITSENFDTSLTKNTSAYVTSDSLTFLIRQRDD